MVSAWQKFLINRGAEFADDVVASFGAPGRERRMVFAGAVMADLSHLGILKVAGKDAGGFLQNQLTNDVSKLQNGQSQYSAWCNNKGRVISFLQVLKQDDYFLLVLPLELIATVGQRLAGFILRSEVRLEQIIDQIIVGVSGPEVYTKIRSGGLDCPEDSFAHIYTDGVLISAIPGVMARAMIISNIDKIKQIWSHLDVNLAPVGKNAWDLVEIRAGIPVINKTTSEMFVAQMLNLDILPAVDFKKGCYPGQEVVARLHYLGKTKRRMYHVEIDRDDVLMPGAGLKSASSNSTKGAGNIVMSAINGDDKMEALAVLEAAVLVNDDLTDEAGNAVKSMEIQY